MWRKGHLSLIILLILATMPTQVAAAILADGAYGYVQVRNNEARIYYSTYTDGSVRIEIEYSVTSAAVFDIAVVEPWEENPVTWELSNYTRYVPEGYNFPEPPEKLWPSETTWRIEWPWLISEAGTWQRGTAVLYFSLKNPDDLSSDLLVGISILLDIQGAFNHTKVILDFSPDGGGCPTLLVWNGTDFVEESVIDIHSENSDVTVAKVLDAKPALVNNSFYLLKLAEVAEGFNYSESHIDYVELVIVMWKSDGFENYVCRLVRAEHLSLGVVTRELRKSDDVRVTVTKGEEITLIFKAPKGCGEVVAFVFFIEGHNPVKE